MSNTTEKNAIADLISGLLAAFELDESKIFETIAAHPSIARAKQFIEKREVDGFQLFVMHPVESVFQQIVRASLKSSPQSDEKMLRYAEFIFLHAGEIENHYERLFHKIEGNACCADKSRTIMKLLLRFFLEGKEIKFNYEQEYTYHLPKKIFKTHEEIVEFFYGLHEFHYGSPDRYIKAFAEVLKKGSQ